MKLTEAKKNGTYKRITVSRYHKIYCNDEFLTQFQAHYHKRNGILLDMNEMKGKSFWPAVKTALVQEWPDIPAGAETISTREAEELLNHRFKHATLWNKGREGFLRTSEDGSLYLFEIRSLKSYVMLLESLLATKTLTTAKDFSGNETIAVIPKRMARLGAQNYEQELKAVILALQDPFVVNFLKAYGIDLTKLLS